ncbi:hypothetical protein GCM10008090_30650 [Arenicella chitinivorans]|uniref:DUF2971 domain-containing protein n=1 Tax=Arenicella chitinivorans TaxID=1329800 RepID=A0A918S3G6_9GAMM|nr:DUF2971 domain-containing protein [Arenicella chitinivorans]GHA18877.1 hypothetical protein GCM10008090_30650 [Arenicella chitinivorans]
MIDLLKDIPPEKALAHYTTMPTALEGILRTHSIRFRPITAANDPRESRRRWSGISWEGANSKFESTVLSEFERAQTEYVKMFCFSKSDPNIHPLFTQAGLCYALPNMWAHYGDRHKGVCLLFDESKIVEMIPPGKLMAAESISYDDFFLENQSIGSFGNFDQIDAEFGGNVSEFVKAHIQKEFQPDLLKKDNGWRGEQEFRALIYDRDPDTREHLDLGYGESLVGIVLGIDFSEVYIPLIKEYTSSQVRLWRLAWSESDGTYKTKIIT